MKKKLTIGTPTVPAREINFVSKIRDSINRFLPSDCQIKTARDAWHVSAICTLAMTFVFPPAVLALVYCIIQAKKGGAQ